MNRRCLGIVVTALCLLLGAPLAALAQQSGNAGIASSTPTVE